MAHQLAMGTKARAPLTTTREVVQIKRLDARKKEVCGFGDFNWQDCQKFVEVDGPRLQVCRLARRGVSTTCWSPCQKMGAKGVDFKNPRLEDPRWKIQKWKIQKWKIQDGRSKSGRSKSGRSNMEEIVDLKNPRWRIEDSRWKKIVDFKNPRWEMESPRWNPKIWISKS